jgi:NitT/TauT family transport system substrate-binding protein
MRASRVVFAAAAALSIAACTSPPQAAPTSPPAQPAATTAPVAKPTVPAPTVAPTVAPTTAPAPTVAAAAKPTNLNKATLRLDWSWFPYHTPFVYAKDKGYYADEGIDLEVLQGQGSGSTVTLVGNKSDTFGFADTGTAAVQISKGVPVKVAGVIQRQASFGTACFKDVNFKQPKDLEGHSVIFVPQESTAQIWPAYLKINNVDESKVTVRNADFSNKVQLFVQHQADCMAGLVGQDSLQAKLLNPDIEDPIPWSQNGIHLFGHGIEVTTDTISSDPEMVRGFMRATVKAWKEICANPGMGAEYFIQKFPDVNTRDSDKDFARFSMPFECKKNDPGPGDSGQAYGPTTDTQWQTIIDLLHQYGGLDEPKALSTYFTDEFLPKP